MRLGDQAPNFKGESTIGELEFHEYIKGSWCLFFAHPEDFTPVCTTEIGRLSLLEPEFTKRNVKLVGLSIDPVRRHREWIIDIEDIHCSKVNFPIVDDSSRSISEAYGMLDQKTNDPTNFDQHGMPFTVRSVFLIDPKRRIRLIMTYPASCGRNFDEILRCFDSLQLSDAHPVTTPANWKVGDKVIVHPSISTEEASVKFSELQVIKPYFRLAKL